MSKSKIQLFDDYYGYTYPFYDNDDSFDVQLTLGDIARQESTARTMSVPKHFTSQLPFQNCMAGCRYRRTPPHNQRPRKAVRSQILTRGPLSLVSPERRNPFCD